MAKKRKKPIEPLEAIKRLLILKLVKEGVTSEEIGRVLAVDSSAIRHMVPIKRSSKLQSQSK